MPGTIIVAYVEINSHNFKSEWTSMKILSWIRDQSNN